MDFQVTDGSTPSGSKRTMNGQGFMLIKDCALSRAGVTEYAAGNFQPRMYNDRDPNDVIRVYRSEATLAASVALWQGSPLTNDHPPEFINGDNLKQFQEGAVVGMPYMQGPLLLADVMVTGAGLIAAINAGKTELSNGYYSGYEFTPGTAPNGVPYDCEQLALRPNHVAVVAAGRCGSICRVSDSTDVIPEEKEPKMATVTVGGVTYEATEQLVQVVNNLQSQLAELMAQAAAAPEQAQQVVAEATAKVDEVTAQVEELTSQLEEATSPGAIDAAVEERQETMDMARKVIPGFVGKGKTNLQIRQEIVKAKRPDISQKNLDSADYVRACLETLALEPAAPAKRGSALEDALRGSLKTQDNADTDIANVDAARNAAIERRKTAYKTARK